MKHLLYLLAIAITAVSFTACRDNCKDIYCKYGVCNDGYCECHSGFDGVHCEIIVREKMLGTYSGSLNCAASPEQKNVTATITAPADKGLENYIHIQYGDTTVTKLCSVERDNSFSYSFTNGTKLVYTIEGKYYDGQITFTEEVTENGTVTHSCTYVGAKQ